SFIPPPRRPTLFPYTTLFRSSRSGPAPAAGRARSVSGGLLASPAQPRVEACGLPREVVAFGEGGGRPGGLCVQPRRSRQVTGMRSEEHTSELQSRENLVCRLL